MRVLVLYASDLQPRSRIAPGGITSNLRGYLGGLPRDWDIEVWGAVERGAGRTGECKTIPLQGRDVRLRSLVEAEPAALRRVPLAMRYCAALAAKTWQREVSDRRWDVLIAHRAEYLATIAAFGARASPPPSIVMIHGSSAFAYQGLGAARGSAYLWSERVSVRCADAVALVSGSSLPYYQARYPRSAERFHWIPNGVDVKRFTRSVPNGWREQHGLTERDRLLVYHGRYDREKGIGRMLEALRVLLEDGEPWHLLCAGIGPLQRLLGDAASSWGRGHVHDVGYLGPDKIVSLLHAGDLGLLCSEFEGLSNGLLEALAAGLPVVATDVGDNSLVLRHLAPELVCDSTSSAVASAIRWAWKYRGELSARTSAVAERFSLAARVERLATLIEDVSQGTVRRGAYSE
jgi:glycosyltransferase involved in cell wall biosynthesis